MSKPKRKVLCVELDEVFDSIQEAAWILDLHQKCIWRCCNGKQKKTKKKYSFRYLDYTPNTKKENENK